MGRDVHPYRVAWAGLWLIATFPAAQVNIDDYPAIRRWLGSFGRRLHQTGEELPGGGRARKKTQNAWWELQDSCAYYEIFRRPKLMWRDLSECPRFAYSGLELYCNDKAFILTRTDPPDGSKTTNSTQLQYLLGVLNSPVVDWYSRRVMPTTGAGIQQWKKFSIEIIPVPRVDSAVRKAIAASAAQLNRDREKVRHGGREGDESMSSIVSELYGLTGAEKSLLLRV